MINKSYKKNLSLNLNFILFCLSLFLNFFSIFPFLIFQIWYYWEKNTTQKNKSYTDWPILSTQFFFFWQIYLNYLQLKNLRPTSHFNYTIKYVRLIICFNIFGILSPKNIQREKINDLEFFEKKHIKITILKYI